MDGIETIKYLKKHDATKGIPIIMATGVMTSTENLQTALVAGAADYVRKPIDKIELAARVRSALNLSAFHVQIKEQNNLLKLQKAEIETVVDELEKANNTKDKFLSIIAHDLISPFNSILGVSELLKADYMEATDRALYVDMIQKTAENTYSLLLNLLDWARTMTNTISYKPKKNLINELIANNIILHETQAKNKNISLIDTTLEDIFVYADNYMINTIFRNLITNAIKFSTNTNIELNAYKQNAMCIISVKDYGVGIDKEIISLLFQLDKKISTKGTNKEKGTGMGLNLCYEFVTKNNGEIWVESEVGKGSTFFFSLEITKNQDNGI